MHLIADVRMLDNFGILGNFSCFRFENYMSTIKKLLREEDKPLHQLSRRFGEIESINKKSEKARSSELYLEKEQFDGPVHKNDNIKGQYKMVRNSLYTICCGDKRNNCCILKHGEYIEVENIIQCKNETIVIIGKKVKCRKKY